MEETKLPPKCHQKDCGGDAFYRYTWPGEVERFICVLCAAKVAKIAATIGLNQQFIPLYQ